MATELRMISWVSTAAAKLPAAPMPAYTGSMSERNIWRMAREKQSENHPSRRSAPINREV